IVFRYPVNPSQDFIKRVIGLAGDEVVYRYKKLTVNGVPLPQAPDGNYGYLEGLMYVTAERFQERSGEHVYTIAENRTAQPVLIVFRYPVNPSQDFIKRVIGLAGDEVVYRYKKLTVNGVPLPQAPDGNYGYLEGLMYVTAERFQERSGEHVYTIAENPTAQPVYPQNVRAFPGRENCVYNEQGFSCKVPAGNYLMMGDNRDNSDDSRYWGFVPDDHIRGKAFFIWFNWDDIASLAFKRVGSGIR